MAPIIFCIITVVPFCKVHETMIHIKIH